jgi:hypothetical protein
MADTPRSILSPLPWLVDGFFHLECGSDSDEIRTSDCGHPIGCIPFMRWLVVNDFRGLDANIASE